MSEINTMQALPTETTTLAASEYLRFVELLEGGMPKDTRAYLVIKEGETRVVHPVGNGHSVLDVRTDLLKHLKEVPTTVEQATELRDWCNDLLQRKGVAEVNLSTERHDLLTDAAHEAALLIDNAREISEDNKHGELEKSLLLRGQLKRLSELVGVIDGAVNPDGDNDSDELLHERLYG